MEQRKNIGKGALLFTLLFPFVGLIASLSHWRESWAKNAFWLACVYLGAVLIFWPEGTVLGDGSDGGRYVLKLQDMYNSGISIEAEFIKYFVESDGLDLYFPTTCYIVSRFTDNGHVLFAFFAFVFGFFYSRNIWYVLEKLPKSKLAYLFVLLALFFLINPISNINGVRFNTAVHVFVYALMPYLLEKDKSKLWWFLAAPLIHFSFTFIVILTVVYILITYKIKSFNPILLKFSLFAFIVSLFINSLNLTSLNSILNEYTPEAYEHRVDGYVNEDVAERNEEMIEQVNWYVSASGVIKTWTYSILMILLFPFLKKIKIESCNLLGLYVFSLLFGALANLLSLIPSGGRFQLVSQMFMVSLILLFASNMPNDGRLRKYVRYSSIVLIIPFVVDIRKLFDFFGITAILGNYLTVFFWESNVMLIDYVKSFI